VIDIKSVNINLTKINSNNIVNSKDGMNFFITNGLFYKIID